MADETTGMYDYFLSELDKVSKIDVTVKSLKKEQKQIVVDVEEVKEFVGIEETEKEANVIDKDKLPAVLTGNEKKRYENIGKQFVEGAGKEFIRIKNAIKFKNNMSTVRDTFLKGFDKIKSTVKTMRKKSGFWTKLLEVVALLTIVAYVFRDKIAKIMPNVGGKIKEVLESGKKLISNLINDIFENVSKSVGKSFGSIISHMLTNTLPNIVTMFFQWTLPEALLATWLTVLSTFSSSAEQRLGEMIDDGIGNVAEEVGSGAEAQIITKGGTQEVQGGEIEAVLKLQRDIEVLGQTGQMSDQSLREFISEAGIAAVYQEGAKNSQVQATLDNMLDVVVGQNVDLKKYVDEGKFDITSFLTQYQNRINNAADKEVETVRLLAQTLGESLTEEQIQQRAAQLRQSASNKNAYDVITQAATAQKRLQDEAGRIIALNATKNQELDAEQERIRKIAEQPPIQVDFNEVFDTKITDTLKDVLGTLKKFIGGDSVVLQNYIKSGMDKVAAFYRLFFEGSLDAIFKVIEGVSSIADGNAGESSYLLENRVEGNNNIVINVDLSDSSSDALIKAVTALRESESGIVAKMEETNKKLEEVAKTIQQIGDLHAASVQYVDGKDKELHTIMDAKEALVWGQVNKNKSDITVIRNSLQNSSMSPTKNENIPVVMLGNVR